MNRTLIWIDDSEVRMENVVTGMISALWREGINSRIVFFGDYDGLSQDFSEDRFKDFILDSCNDELSSLETNENEIGCKLQNAKMLIENPDFQLVKNLDPSLKPVIQNLMNNWKSIEKNFLDTWSNKKKLDSAFDVKVIFDNLDILEDSTFALDVVLLEGDYKKIKEDCLPIISLEIYHYITDVLKSKCVIYSTYTYLNKLQYNWKELYKKRYDSDVEIYSRERLDYCTNEIEHNEIKNVLKEITIK